MTTKCAINFCELDTYLNEDRCIIHSENPGKDNTAFTIELSRNTLIWQPNALAGDILFDSIVFPMGFGISIFLKRVVKIQDSPKNITITNCIFNNDINLIRVSGKDLLIELNKAHSVTLDRLQFESVRIRSNRFHYVEISQSDLTNLILSNTSNSKDELVKIKEFFQISTTIKYTQIFNQFFNTFHIAISNFEGSFYVDGISTNNFLIRDSVFYENVYLKEIKPQKNFILKRCIIQKPRLFTILQSDLSNSGFNGTDISAINLIDNKWRGDGNKQIKILDHYLAEKDKPYDNKDLPFIKVTPAECAETYRQLKINFESKGNYIDAGDFHHGEMEMRRLSGGFLSKYFSIYSIYKFLSGYGERPIRAIIIFLTSIIILASLQILIGFKIDNITIDYDLNLTTNLENYPSFNTLLNSIQLTFSNLTLRKIDNLKMVQSNWNTILWIFETIFGPLQLALIILAIKRKVKR